MHCFNLTLPCSLIKQNSIKLVTVPLMVFYCFYFIKLKRQETPKSEPEKKKKNTQDQKPVTLQKLAKVSR